MQVKIDTRPLADRHPFAVVALSRFLLFLISPCITSISSRRQTGFPLTGFRVLMVFLACIFLWMTQLLPLPVTGLFALDCPVASRGHLT